MRETRLLIKVKKLGGFTENENIQGLTKMYNPTRIEPQDHSNEYWVFALYGPNMKAKFERVNKSNEA